MKKGLSNVVTKRRENVLGEMIVENHFSRDDSFLMYPLFDNTKMPWQDFWDGFSLYGSHSSKLPSALFGLMFRFLFCPLSCKLQ